MLTQPSQHPSRKAMLAIHQRYTAKLHHRGRPEAAVGMVAVAVVAAAAVAAVAAE